jgi:RNA polymerase sigma-70 factor (ECF subfamily)
MEFFPFDDDYVRRLQEGDPLTEDHFVSYFTPILRIKVRSRLRSPEATDDVVQETFLRVFKTLRDPASGGIRNGHSFGAYVARVCENVIFEWIRGDRRVQPIDDNELLKLITSETREDELIKEQRRECVRRIISEMGRREREILTAVILEEQSKEDACKKFGVSQDYLRVRLHRAREKFREAWEKEQTTTRPDPDETDPAKPSLPN